MVKELSIKVASLKNKTKKAVFYAYEKIIKTIPTMFYECDSIIKDPCNWVKKISCFYFKIIKILPMCLISVFLSRYTEFIKSSIYQNPQLYFDIKKKWLNQFNEEDDFTKYFMAYLFYECEIFDSEIINAIMKFLNVTSSLEYRYWMSMHISKMTFFNQSGFYPRYYLDRREVIKKIAGELEKPNKLPLKEENIHIVILTYLLDDNMNNSMQRVATMMAKNLKRSNNKITVLCLDCLHQVGNEKKSLIQFMQYKASKNKSERIQKLFGSDVIVEYVSGNNYLERMQRALDSIYHFSPNIIIDITDEYSPMSYHYSKDYFTVNIPMRGAVTSQFYSAILGVPFKYEQTNIRFDNCVDMSKVLEWSFPEYIPLEQGTFTKKDIRLSDDQFCIISIGDNSSFNNDFIDEICWVLNNNDKLVWLLVGNDAPNYLHQKYAELLADRKVIEWGYENNLAGICRACDAHLRYDMTGGSGATAIAAMQGLPIVMTNFVCDASRWLGLDYSSINNYHDLALEIQLLYKDSDYYKQRKKVTLELVEKAVDSKEKWDDLYEKLSKAYESWRNK